MADLTALTEEEDHVPEAQALAGMGPYGAGSHAVLSTVDLPASGAPLLAEPGASTPTSAHAPDKFTWEEPALVWQETWPAISQMAVLQHDAENMAALDSLEQRSQELLDLTSRRHYGTTASPLPAIMTGLHSAMAASSSATHVEGPELEDITNTRFYSTPESPLPHMMADLQLAMDASSEDSYADSEVSDPSSAYMSAANAELLPMWPLRSHSALESACLERPGLYDFQHQLQSQRDTSDRQFLPNVFKSYDLHYGPFEVDTCSDDAGNNALCKEWWSLKQLHQAHMEWPQVLV